MVRTATHPLPRKNPASRSEELLWYYVSSRCSGVTPVLASKLPVSCAAAHITHVARVCLSLQLCTMQYAVRCVMIWSDISVLRSAV